MMKHILIVEDHVDNAYLIECALRSSEWVIDVVFTGKEALESCQRKQYDLIVFDLNLPDILGENVASMLRDTTEYKQIPFIAYTARDSLEADSEKLFSAVLMKPILPCYIRDTIQQLLANRS